MTRTLMRGAAIAVLVSYAALAFAPNYALADDRERLSSAPVMPNLSIVEHGFQVAQGKKQGGGGGGGGQTCPTGYADCDGVKSNKCETNIQTDVSNCGACGKTCGPYTNAKPACTNGICEIAGCTARGYADCDKDPSNGCEVNFYADANNCGACGAVCSLPHATAACVNGSCEMGSCATGYADCDGNASNGCEIRTDTNVFNCGACGNKCNLPNVYSYNCIAGSCAIKACQLGACDKDKDPSNGCEAPAVGGGCY